MGGEVKERGAGRLPCRQGGSTVCTVVGGSQGTWGDTVEGGAMTRAGALSGVFMGAAVGPNGPVAPLDSFPMGFGFGRGLAGEVHVHRSAVAVCAQRCVHGASRYMGA